MNFAIPDLYDFLRGPGIVISLIVFSAGFFYRTLRLIRATHKIRMSSINSDIYVQKGFKSSESNQSGRVFPSIKTRLKNTVFTTNPVMGIISLIFHILLFIVPVFLSAHNIIADLTIGLSLPAIPEKITDVFTLVLMLIGGFFLVRRIFIPRVRMISTTRDYLILLFVMAPFISGFLAYHHFFNYHAVIYLHMIIGEIAIMVLPFTSLVHMPFIIFSRFFIDSEHSITTGNRRW